MAIVAPTPGERPTNVAPLPRLLAYAQVWDASGRPCPIREPRTFRRPRRGPRQRS